MPIGSQLHRVKPLQKFDHEHLNRMVVELNGIFARLTERVEKNPLSTGSLQDDLDVSGFRITNHGSPDGDSHLVTRGDLKNEIRDLVNAGMGADTSAGFDGGLGGDPTSENPTAGGGGGGSGGVPFEKHFKELEFDVGSTPLRAAKLTISDADVTTTSFIMLSQSANAATGKVQDENEMDRLAFAALPGTQLFTLYVSALDGPITGKFKAFYAVVEGA